MARKFGGGALGFILGVLVSVITAILYLAFLGGDYLLQLSPRYHDMASTIDVGGGDGKMASSAVEKFHSIVAPGGISIAVASVNGPTTAGVNDSVTAPSGVTEPSRRMQVGGETGGTGPCCGGQNWTRVTPQK